MDIDESDPDFPDDYTQTEGDEPTTIDVLVDQDVFAGNDGYAPPPCDLHLEHFCSVRQMVMASDCLGKVVQMVFEYTGAGCQASSNNQSKDKCESTDMGDGDLGDLEDVILIKDPNKAAAPDLASREAHVILTALGDDLGSETILKVIGSSQIVQTLTIHTSCSQPLKVGDQYGSLRLVELTSTLGGTVGEQELPPTSHCSFEMMIPSCEILGKPASLTFLYSGGGCQDSANQQGDKFGCIDNPNGLAPGDFVDINITKDADKLSWQQSLDEQGHILITFAHRDQKFGSETKFDLIGTAGTQSLNIHTSCSRPLALSDMFGSLTLIGYNGNQQGTTVEYTYEITNSGPVAVVELEVADDRLGNVDCSETLEIGEKTTCGATAVYTEVGTYVNTLTVAGHGQAGQRCQAQASATVEALPPPPCEISAGPISLKKKNVEWTLVNTGRRNATIQSISLSWPSVMGNLKKVKRGGKTISRAEFAPPYATITTFVGSASDRSLPRGKTDKLKFEFSNESASSAQDYSIELTFEEECFVTTTPQ